MTTSLSWLLALLIVVMLSGIVIAIPGNTGYPEMSPYPPASANAGGAVSGGMVIPVPTAVP